MEQKIQNKLIQWILQPLGAFMERFSEKQRKILFCGGCLMIFFTHFFYSAFPTRFRFLYLYTFDCLMLGLMILAILPAKLKAIRFDRILAVPWVVVVVFMLIAGVTKTEDYLPDAMLFLVAYPVIFIVGCNLNFSRVQHWLFLTVRISFAVFLVILLLFFPITQRQYPGFFTNVNAFAIYLALVFSASLLQLLEEEKAGPRFWFCLASTGISAALTYYSNSRTGLAGILSAFLFTFFLLLFIDRGNFPKRYIHVFLSVILSIAVFLPSTIYLSRIPQTVITTLSQISRPVGPQETAPSALEVLDQIWKTEKQKTNTDLTLNEISTGRISIWKAYIERLDFWGHSNKDRFFVEARGTLNSTCAGT